MFENILFLYSLSQLHTLQELLAEGMVEIFPYLA